jgi:Tfp pilus assembly protein PilO
MTGRDRLVAICVGFLLVIAVVWLVVVSPERKQAASLNAQVSAASAQLAAANSQVATARSAQAQYAAAYASIVRLGKAVPPSQEVPSLIYQIAQATHQKNVEFSSITSGLTGTSPTASAAAAAAPAGFTQLPFTFTFGGSFDDLYHLFQQLDRYTVVTHSGVLLVNGRLLTIQSVKLSPEVSGGPAAAKGSSGRLTGTITATAYVLPAVQGLTAGATPVAPAGAASPTSTPAAASSAGATSSPTAPAIARVTP